MTSPSLPIRPAFALRVGITGTRDIPEDNRERLHNDLTNILSAAARTAQHQSTTHLSKAVFESGPSLRFLSPLARGADRLAAAAALAEGFTLHVPMPFPQAEYEQDFTADHDLAEFHALLSQAASYICLDGDREHDRNRGYEAVGRYVARNCDLLLAVWDGAPPDHRGGTAEIVEFALTSGVPIIWLHAHTQSPPVWLEDMQDLRDAVGQARHGAPAPARGVFEHLTAHLHTLVHPPAPCPRSPHSLLARVAHFAHRKTVDPLREYYHATYLPDRDIWRVHAWFMRIMAQQNTRPAKIAKPITNAVALYWHDRYVHADRLAGQYANRYRSGYTWTFLFATLSVLFGAVGLIIAGAPPGSLPAPFSAAGSQVSALLFGVLELVMICLVLAIVIFGIRGDWHEHSIEYRILAELYRKQQALGPLGWTLPITEIGQLTDPQDGSNGHAAAAQDRGAWVGWLFAAMQRAAPLPTGTLDAAEKPELHEMIEKDFIAEQIDYHAARKIANHRAGRTLSLCGDLGFFAVLLIVILKLPTEVWADNQHNWIALLGLAATILPAITAAFVGIRAYAEVPLLEVQSHHTGAALTVAMRRVQRLNMARPFAAQELGAEAADVATLMLQDLEGWARLFRVKALEAGG